jgi:hypothetical protein
VTAPHPRTHESSASAPPSVGVAPPPKLVDVLLTTTLVVIELAWLLGLAGLIAFAIWR